MEPARLVIDSSASARVMRLGMAVMVVLGWVALQVADVVLSVMFFSEPNFPEVALVTSPVLLAVPWIVAMASARGVVEVHPGSLVVRHRRVLRRPLVIARTDVRRILLDDGSATGRARFATGDPAEPLLWTDPVVRRQHDDRPIIGDSLLPNMAIELHTPLAMDAARDEITAVPANCEITPPRRRGRARALLLAMEDLDAVRRAMVGWPVETPDAAAVIPREVAEAARRVPQDARALVAMSAVTGLLLAAELYALAPFAFGLTMLYVVGMVRRRQAAAQSAREAVGRRSAFLSPEDRATAMAAIDANLRTGSTPPPGWEA